MTEHGGYACFTMSGTPVDWPAGFSALDQRGRQPQVRMADGTVLQLGAAYQLGIVRMQSKGDACTASGQDVTAILSIKEQIGPTPR